jgi:hypothetical protein
MNIQHIFNISQTIVYDRNQLRLTRYRMNVHVVSVVVKLKPHLSGIHVIIACFKTLAYAR